MAAVNRVKQHESAVERGQTYLQETVEEHPLPTILAAFGVGLGIGTLIGCAIAGDPEPEHMATRLGRRVLDSLHGYVPESLRR